jgi:hypothetical protein
MNKRLFIHRVGSGRSDFNSPAVIRPEAGPGSNLEGGKMLRNCESRSERLCVHREQFLRGNIKDQ